MNYSLTEKLEFSYSNELGKWPYENAKSEMSSYTVNNSFKKWNEQLQIEQFIQSDTTLFSSFYTRVGFGSRTHGLLKNFRHQVTWWHETQSNDPQ